MTTRQLVLDASARALRFRRLANVSLFSSLCVYDVAQTLGIEVRFIDIGSMEGMYRKKPEPLILVSSLRPPGRQNFTCAHELGHHEYGHGMHIDELTNITRGSSRLEETQANLFASFLLMPKTAVERAFAIRGWKPGTCTPDQVYIIAGWLGVGYSTLIWHMFATLCLITQHHSKTLLKSTPKQIRSRFLNGDISEHLLVVDSKWETRPIDLRTGSLVLVPSGTVSEGTNMQLISEDSNGSLFEAVVPGLGRFCNPSTDWASYVRVSREDFIGRSIYRHEPEYVDEEDNIGSSADNDSNNAKRDIQHRSRAS